MRHALKLAVIGSAFASVVSPAFAESFSAHVKKLEARAIKAGISKSIVSKATRGLKADPSIDRLTKKQPELVKPIGGYITSRVNGRLVTTGRAKAKANRRLAKNLKKTFGVDPNIVFAIWGMETGFGAGIGKSNVPRSLATLSWKQYRGDFFTKEFVDALRIAEAEKLDPRKMVGSWAGAMGQTQFIPSSFRKFAVDMNNNGKRDLWRETGDALASTANFLASYGWVPSQPWGMPVSLPKSLPRDAATRSWADWAKRGVKASGKRRFPKSGDATMFFPAGAEGPAFLITSNYEIIREYNSSDAYSLSAALVGDRIGGVGSFKPNWPTGKTLNKAERMKVQSRLAAKGFDVPNRTGRIIKGVRMAIRDFQRSIKVTSDGYPDQELLRQLSR
ncbi:lytic murein transglycosylase [Ahrensia sp. R2A130]|nr:lytic murein transglycosylase [Ahrensia sp. R2A130]